MYLPEGKCIHNFERDIARGEMKAEWYRNMPERIEYGDMNWVPLVQDRFITVKRLLVEQNARIDLLSDYEILKFNVPWIY